jgi:hypothetical protein
MSGALESILEMSVSYSMERSQFGKPISKFQAIQQQIKDVGNAYERLVPEVVRLSQIRNPSARFLETLNQCVLHAPSFTLRGGTREILKGVIARGLGLR